MTGFRIALAVLAASVISVASGASPGAARVTALVPGMGPPLQPPAFAGKLPNLGAALPFGPKRDARRLRLAHAIIVRTSPEQGAVAPEAVGKVDVWYNEGIRNDFVALAVIDQSGMRVDKRDAAIDSADQSHVSTSVGPLAPGQYTVRYRAVSADGHIVSGAWGFEVRQP